MLHRIYLVLAPAVFYATAAASEGQHGQFSFGAERSCAASGKFSADLCANAAADAQAEFDEKAPRFSTREDCERVFGRVECSVGFSGVDGWAGKRSGVYFTPRQTGFRILASSERDIIVVPYVGGSVIGFSPRTILRKDTKIDPGIARRAQEAWRVRSTFGASGPGAAGLETPPPAEPNFDCAALLEVGSNPKTGCLPAPARRR